MNSVDEQLQGAPSRINSKSSVANEFEELRQRTNSKSSVNELNQRTQSMKRIQGAPFGLIEELRRQLTQRAPSMNGIGELRPRIS